MWYTGSAFVLILATTCFLYWAVATTLEHEDDRYLLDKARVLIAILKEDLGNERELRVEVERESGPRPAGEIFVRLLDDHARTIAETVGMAEVIPATQFHSAVGADSEIAPTHEIRSPKGQSFRALAIRAPNSGVVQVAMDRTAEEDLLKSYRWYAVGILSCSLLACALAGYTLARHGMAPLRAITLAAQRVRTSTLHQRIDVTSLPAELADLADTFNDMLSRLEESFRRLERFSADIAHELRTPVNNLRGETEVALGQTRTGAEYREILTSGLEEFGRLTELIDSLLFLARAESPQAQIDRQNLDLRKELATVQDFYQAAADDAEIELKIQAAPGLVASLDRTLLQRAIGNLVANAIAHTHKGGTVWLSAAGNGSSVFIEVADTGHGIAAEHLPHVFDRFYRADSARTSAKGSVGLGLALVKSITTLHGGTCTIKSELNRGTRVRLTFPTPTLATEGQRLNGAPGI